MVWVPKNEEDEVVKKEHAEEDAAAEDSPNEGFDEEESYEDEGGFSDEGHDVDIEGDSEEDNGSQEEEGYGAGIDDYYNIYEYDLEDDGYEWDMECHGGSFMCDLFNSYTRPVTPAIPPPPPRHLADREAFIGPNAPVWAARGANHHLLVDPTTRRPALLAIQMKVASDNFWVTKSTVQDMTGEKIFCVGQKPDLPGFDGYWRKCMDQLDGLMQQFVTRFPQKIRDNDWSFMQRRVDGIRLKLQQPLTKKDFWMYGLEDNPYYADFLQHCPSECKYIDAQASSSDQTRSRIYINPLPAHDKDGSIIPPSDYEEKFSDNEVIVEAEFQLHHFTFPNGRSFIACPHSLQLVDVADVIGPQNTLSRKNEHSVIKREIKEEADVKQEEYEEVLGLKGKRRAVSQEPCDFARGQRGVPAELIVKKEEDDIAGNLGLKKRRLSKLD